MRIRGCHTRGNAGLALFSPCSLRCVYTSPSYPVSISPVVPPPPSPSPAAMPASRILSRAIARPPVPRVLKPVSPPPPPKYTQCYWPLIMKKTTVAGEEPCRRAPRHRRRRPRHQDVHPLKRSQCLHRDHPRSVHLYRRPLDRRRFQGRRSQRQRDCPLPGGESRLRTRAMVLALTQNSTLRSREPSPDRRPSSSSKSKTSAPTSTPTLPASRPSTTPRPLTRTCPRQSTFSPTFSNTPSSKSLRLRGSAMSSLGSRKRSRSSMRRLSLTTCTLSLSRVRALQSFMAQL